MTIATNCTESEVQARIMIEKQSGSSVLVPNYTPGLYWENDLFQVTKAGYWVEFEIKRSISDYRADFKKVQQWSGHTNENSGYRLDKHELLGSFVGEHVYDPYAGAEWLEGKHIRKMKLPNRFYFCLPFELISKIEVPKHAGLIAYERRNGKGVQPVYFKVIKNAPLLHKIKHGQSIIRPAMTTGHNRFIWQFMKKHIDGLN